MPRSPLSSWLSEHWSSIEEQVRGLDGGLSQTLRPTIVGSGSGATRPLEQIGAVSGLTLGVTLGTGGMGIVREGVQVVLDRPVAVKGVRAERREPHSVVKLLQEAWVAARLEHPNIVPVYDVGRDEDGTPLLIMRRIEGVVWKDLADDAAAVRERFGAEDLLEWNLRVLMQVANAVSFAHSRGILHLDLKPANVMIGAFGEVYLVDWGLAMSLDPNEERVPRAADNAEIVGTAMYVAPEMLTGDGSWLGRHTDVYLLGGCLFELLTGHPPHQGDTHLSVFFHAATQDPVLPDDSPPELADLCRRALSRSPELRPADAESLRLGVQAFLQHRGSARLADEAKEALDAAERAVQVDPRAVHRLLTEARFGYRQALAAWPDNPEAGRGHRRATVRLAEAALAAGDISTAGALAAQLSPPDEALEGSLAEARREAAEREATLRSLTALRADLDPRTGQRTRVFLVGVMGLAWTLVPLPAALNPDSPSLSSHVLYVATPLSFLALAGVLGVWARESMLATRFNRRAGGLVVIAMCGQLAMALTAWSSAVAPAKMLPLYMALWATVAAAFSLVLDRRGWIFTAGFLGSLGITLLWPGLAYWSMIGAAAIFLGTVVTIWRPDHVRGPVGMDPGAEGASPPAT